ncbi:heparinase II/III domain-containing protein [Paenibacillus eucommiae]|uniref:Heparinase II/III-like C-terminal domain-containing protein n=1 Tax=Paenibacillus eucommiae TaxID=1355755 RepID=A0ABS4J3C7_9BACL|nr:heparinase II/III family protein [Paenibacillus eucommiae]MBP1993790.1 hypothetical protein [Paenibacillus eucommiae]
MNNHALAQADIYVAQGLDFFWKLVPPQSLPRSIFVNQTIGSPITGREIDQFGNYPYTFDPIHEPWKITDPSSGYKFPANDFQSYYESGLNEHGLFDQSLADPVYLVNTLYPEKGPDWCVDDGLGWIDGNGHYFTFIAYYVHWALWGYDGKSIIQKALRSLKDAYLYTGDLKYARAGVVLLDRIADVYPSQDIYVHGMTHYFNSHGLTGHGKAVGNIWEPFLLKDFLKAYEAFRPVLDDPELIAFLSAKSLEYRLGPLKHSAEGIRRNIETGVIEQIYPGVKKAQIASNNGIHQSALALAAVIYDKLPETKEWLDFNFKTGDLEGPPYCVTGGNMGVTFVNGVDRDGAGDESSLLYNQLWLDSYLETADIMKGYKGYPGASLYEHVKFRKMFSGLYPLMLAERYTANIGDAGSTGNPWPAFSLTQMTKAFQNYGDPIFAQLAYFRNNNSTEGIQGDMFSGNPEQLANDIQEVIDEHGLLKLESHNMTGFGFAVLRDGDSKADTLGIRYPFGTMLIESMTAKTDARVRDNVLEYEASAQGDSISFLFEVAENKEYEILLQPARSIANEGYGIYLVLLDGQPAAEIDFYGSRRERESLAIRQLVRGKHRIEFMNKGKNSLSAGYKLGLLELALLDGQTQRIRNDTIGTNSLRDMWLYYGRNYGHGHADCLNLGLVAFGLDVSPDLGYPESTFPTDTHCTEWIRSTVAHNTVTVDRSMQTAQWVGDPKRFDGRPRSMVKLVEVEAPKVYPQTELYKRTSAMIRADKANSYVVDFFRVKGGSEHHFSFHGAEGDVEVEGVNMTVQPTGTYAGPEVEYGQRPAHELETGYQYRGAGFHYLKNVERDTAPSSLFSVDWTVKDTWNMLPPQENQGNRENVHLRLTMLGDTDEVALADGIPSRTETGNPERLRYLLVKRSGTDLESTFTSVIEPYKNERFVSGIAALEVKSGGAPVSDMDVRAVKVTLENGRVDYIISALDPEVAYTIDNKLQFKGGFGVYSEIAGKFAYGYVNDGTVIGQLDSPEIYANQGCVDGTVVDFTKQLQVYNEIIVDIPHQDYALNDLVNRSVYVQNDGARNAVYLIKGVSDLGKGRYALDIGDTTLIRSYKDDHDFNQGFIYDIAEGSGFRIPLSYEKENGV